MTVSEDRDIKLTLNSAFCCRILNGLETQWVDLWTSDGSMLGQSVTLGKMFTDVYFPKVVAL